MDSVNVSGYLNNIMSTPKWEFVDIIINACHSKNDYHAEILVNVRYIYVAKIMGNNFKNNCNRF